MHSIESTFSIFLLSVFSGGVASICGFGIGSLLTPALSLSLGTKLAVAAVSIPHFCGTALRCFLLGRNIKISVLKGFGLASALGGLCGALLQGAIVSPALAKIFGCILVFAGFSGLFGLSQKMHMEGKIAVLGGALSGFLGGLVGNQGGIRSAAMLGFDLSPAEFVATATAVGLIVDLSRMPVYFSLAHDGIWQNAPLIGSLVCGVLLGTTIGGYLLRHINQEIFKKTVSLIIVILGASMIAFGKN